ncbi:MAG: glycosyltransferase [Rhodothermales bacterium]|nr:glycosyltransferase [Rhodothermales bacterium]
MIAEAESRQVELSVIVTLTEGGKADPIGDLIRDYKRQFDKIGRSYEFIFVLEGENPEVYRELLDLHAEGAGIRIIKLTHSYRDATAITVGFDNAVGETIVTLPAYHQIEPDEIPHVVESLGDSDLVVVQRFPRKDSLINRLQTRVFHFLLRRMVGSTYRDLGCGVRVVRKRVTEAIHVYGHKHWFLPVLASRFGFKVVETQARQATSDARTRYFKASVYIRRFLDLLSVFFLVKFTKKPLRFFGLSGLFVFSIGLLFTGFLAFQRMFMGVALADRPALLLGILLIVFGIQIFAIGLIGELIIFTHAKDLKDYTVEKIIN